MIVLWRVTEHCNLACGFCAYDRRLPIPRREVDGTLVESFAPVLADYGRATGERILLSWIGGEPLLWKPFFGLSQWLKGLGIGVSTTTNATTLHRPQVRAQILDSLSELTISVDGLAGSHEGVRHWPGGWTRLASSVTALARERDRIKPDFRLRANVVLMHENLGQFEALCEALAHWGIDEITFNQLGGRDRPAFFAAHRLTSLDVDSLRACLPALTHKLAAQGVRLCASPSYLERIAASTLGQPMPILDCGPGQKFLFIDEHGIASPCSFTTDIFGIPIGEIRDLRQLQALPQRFSAMQREKAHLASCRDCPSTQVFAKFTS